METLKHKSGNLPEKAAIKGQWSITDKTCPKCKQGKVAIDIMQEKAKCSYVKCGAMFPYSLYKKGIPSAGEKPHSLPANAKDNSGNGKRTITLNRSASKLPATKFSNGKQTTPATGKPKIETSKAKKLSFEKLVTEEVTDLTVLMGKKETYIYNFMQEYFLDGMTCEVGLPYDKFLDKFEWPEENDEEYSALRAYLDHVHETLTKGKKKEYREVIFWQE